MPPGDSPDLPRVLVTGAAGRLGALAAGHLSASGRCTVRATDRIAAPGVIQADLTAPAAQWRHLLDGTDLILHCAGHRGPDTDWRQAEMLNLDLSLRLMAAARGRIGRFVFLSSNWVMAGYRFGDTPVTSDLPPDPVNPYGISKLAIERAGVALAEAGDFAFVALRIGMVIADLAEAAARLPALRRWSQEMWLSGADFCQGVEKALLAPLAGAAIVNLVSGNPGSRWDLAETERRIGYRPQDGWQPTVPPELDEAEAGFARLDRCRIAIQRSLTAGSTHTAAAALSDVLGTLSAHAEPSE